MLCKTYHKYNANTPVACNNATHYGPQRSSQLCIIKHHHRARLRRILSYCSTAGEHAAHFFLSHCLLRYTAHICPQRRSNRTIILAVRRLPPRPHMFLALLLPHLASEHYKLQQLLASSLVPDHKPRSCSDRRWCVASIQRDPTYSTEA